MSNAGEKCRKWASLETERRFFGNQLEIPLEEQGLDTDEVQKCVEMNEREKGMLLLDPRTLLD